MGNDLLLPNKLTYVAFQLQRQNSLEEVQTERINKDTKKEQLQIEDLHINNTVRYIILRLTK